MSFYPTILCCISGYCNTSFASLTRNDRILFSQKKCWSWWPFKESLDFVTNPTFETESRRLFYVAEYIGRNVRWHFLYWEFSMMTNKQKQTIFIEKRTWILHLLFSIKIVFVCLISWKTPNKKNYIENFYRYILDNWHVYTSVCNFRL